MLHAKHFQHAYAVLCSYEIARNFRPPGRLMFLRPVKTAAQEKASRRTYDTVWITAEVRTVSHRMLFCCTDSASVFVIFPC